MRGASGFGKGARGFTIIELMISSTILVVFLGAVTTATGVMLRTYQVITPVSEMDAVSFRTLERIVNAVSRSGAETLYPDANPPAGTSSLEFKVSMGVANGDRVWSAPCAFEWAEDPRDPQDGTDNDGDGLVDEGMVVWRRDAGSMSETWEFWAEGVAPLLEGELDNGLDDNGNGLVDEKGLCFSYQDGLMTVRLTLLRRLPSGEILTRTVVAAVQLRN